MSIQLNHLTHVYNEGTTFEKVALNDVTLEIQTGEFIGLIGHTGSGKSTLIQHLNGIISPSSGEILLDGENIHKDKAKLKEVRRRIGLAFQYPEYQLFEMLSLIHIYRRLTRLQRQSSQAWINKKCKKIDRK